MNFITKFIREEDGVTAIEYGLIAALVAVVIIAGATALGASLNTLFLNISNCLGGAEGTCPVAAP